MLPGDSGKSEGKIQGSVHISRMKSVIVAKNNQQLTILVNL